MGRRVNGEGALYKDLTRPKQPWTMVKDVRLADGSVRAVKVRGRTQADAVEKMAKRESDLTTSVDSTSTLGEFMRDWLRTKRPLVRASTYRGYEQDFRLYIDPHVGPKRLDRVTTRDVQGLVSRIAADRKFTTADRVRRTMKTAMNQALAWGLIAANPAKQVPAVKRPKPNRGAWSFKDAQAFIEAAEKHGPAWHALFVLALATGLRKGELLALRWTDIQAGRVFVSRSYTPYGPDRYVEPKTPQGHRSIPITDSTMSVLTKHRIGATSELVFPAPKGGPMNPRRPNVMLGLIAQEANVPAIRFHDLRRTFTTWQVASGRDPKTVQKLLGQATPGLALQIYADSMDEKETKSAFDVPGVVGS